MPYDAVLCIELVLVSVAVWRQPTDWALCYLIPSRQMVGQISRSQWTKTASPMHLCVWVLMKELLKYMNLVSQNILLVYFG
jgi:hypothetical protein